MFNMLALLLPSAPDVSLEALADKANALFAGNPKFRMEYETVPFQQSRNVILRWPGWSARLFYETGNTPLKDASEIARILGEAAPPGIAESARRIRAVFRHDPDEAYIDEMVEIMTMLENLENVVVFDPQQNKIMD